MPNRIIKESINESASLAEVSPFAQDLYKRLITYADDYGRFNADLEIILPRLYPRELGAVAIEDIWYALVELAGIDKVRFYRQHKEYFEVYIASRRPPSSRGEHKREIFGYLPGWPDHQRIRNTKKKFPEPEEEMNDWYHRRFIPIELKIRVFERDKFTCQLCHRDFSLPGIPTKRALRMLDGALHIDHTVPVQQGGRATMENLRLLCASCNLCRPKLLQPLDKAPRRKSRQVAATGGPLRPESNPIQSNPIQGGVVAQSKAQIIKTLGKHNGPQRIGDLLVLPAKT